MSGPELVDWDVAVATAKRLAKPGPQVGYAEAAGVVAQLRELSAEAEGHVAAFTRMRPAGPTRPVAILDRPGWSESNVAGFQTVLDPLLVKLAARRPARPGVLTAAGAKVTGAQVGTVLSYLSSRVLGQYEVFVPPEEGEGRLTLVAPNLVETERTLGVDPHDFRLWVCLHEVTHQTQFTAVPWLREHFLTEVQRFVEASDLDPAALRARLRAAASAVADTVRGGEGQSLVEAVQTPEQRVVLERLTALMTLLEGHAEYVMDGVGPEVVPSVATIRARFAKRREGTGAVDRAIRKLLGIDLKMKQYADGARFVRAVVHDAGIDGFNQVWQSPTTLPTPAEVADHSRWLERVLGVRRALPA